MFFNTRGICWTLLAIVCVILLCILDLKCSFARDERARNEKVPQSGALARVKGEMAAGKEAWNQMREEQLNEQLRTFRVMARRFAEAGQYAQARAAISMILEIEREKSRRAAKDAENNRTP